MSAEVKLSCDDRSRVSLKKLIKKGENISSFKARREGNLIILEPQKEVSLDSPENTVLDDGEWERFMDIMNKPDKTNEKMKSAYKQFEKKYG